MWGLSVASSLTSLRGLMMNEVIVALHKRLDNMKANLPSEAATVEQINKYFLEQQEIT